IFRAMFNDVFGSGGLQGGSTITQQYVKQAYLTSQRTLSRKIKEAAIAVKLARTLPKKTILDDYLNTIYFGRGAYGVEAACDAYFLDAVHQELVNQYGAQVVDAGGLRVTTTLDPTLQAKAYDAIYGKDSPIALDPAKGQPAGALVSLDDSGAVRAMVGGEGYG